MELCHESLFRPKLVILGNSDLEEGNAHSKHSATLSETLRVTARSHATKVPLHQRGQHTCAKPISAVKTRF